ncbi:SRPBCC family protein [Subsaximicrobium wynnwilliamsii]|uniref:SRPBCC family protein n=1 Tax=Subsaximicrobium wynnwilliamsii TaxID=291179 RepID=A0A5C6ZI85_9FLAO|nr:SRPBCC family protein [Subsaximicrobium wynnwilliamsii]TXD84240.1 SRPBCC family protein [Subsaximicrobium wynnwilliamsii]TXD89861.1 SRPBCC family protein [Subsaximicrobium wynnwilliamsii]TXE03952.1 SRPBCC family protein [Subsaximicrobium wynnwilliamsii]
MIYNTEIKICLPIEQVIKKIDNVENLKHWQRGLVSAEHIIGAPGALGSKMKFNYRFGNRSMQVVETITKRNLPNEFHASYDTKGIHSIQENYFEKTPEGFTKWVIKCEFLPLNFFMRVMILVSPNMFRKQSEKYMKDFKNFVENEISVANV